MNPSHSVVPQSGPHATASIQSGPHATASITSAWNIGRLAILFVCCVTLLWPYRVGAQTGSPCAAEVVVAQGDTLSGLATRHLGSPAAYPTIVTATNTAAATDSRFAAIQNPNAIAPGWRLCTALAQTTDGGPTLNATPVAPSTIADPRAQISAPVAPIETPTPDPIQPESAATELPFGRPVVEGEPHPLSIEFLRAQSYPGSELRFKQTLAPGTNYSRYIVSYLSEGLEIDAYMTVPTGPRPQEGWPVIVFNHGYIPADVYRSAERYIAYTDAFARAGYIVLRPDYRGHGFSEGEARGAYSRPDYTIDVLNAVASAKQYADADASRIGMWGHSLGGYITLRALVVDPDIKAGVIWAGVVASYADLLEHWRGRAPSGVQRGGGWRATLTEQYGPPDENPEFWASISANSFVADLSGPLQLHHGTADTSVPLLFSELLFGEIAAANGTAQLYTYPGDDHNIAANLYSALQRSVAFFDEHVK